MKAMILVPLAGAVLLMFYIISEITALIMGKRSPWEDDEDL